MKIKTITLSLILVSMFVITGCIKDPEFLGITDLQFVNKTDTTINMQASIELVNHNFFDITGHNIAYKIFINNTQVGSGGLQDNLTLPKKQISVIPNSVQLSLPAVIKEAKFIFDQDSVPIEFEVSGKFTMLGIKKTRRIKVYLRPQMFVEYILESSLLEKNVTIKNVRINGISPKVSMLLADVEFNNSYPITFSLVSSDVDILSAKNGGEKLGSWKSNEEQLIEANQKTTIKVQSEISNINAAKSLFGVLLGNDPTYYLKGKLTINLYGTSIDVPIEQALKL